MLNPTDCIAKDFNSSWYKKWKKTANLPRSRHAKCWEVAAICEALDSRRCLRPGVSALGMGVGREQLASVFASKGVSVTATDQDPNSGKAQKWDNGQLTQDKFSLFYPKIISKKKFDKLVHYTPYDMNSYNSYFENNFDFIWHNCVIGHLGSMAKSIEHLKQSANYLKPGGWLVFTTELNISNFTSTIDDNSDTIIWRIDDLKELFIDLLKVGLVADSLKLRMGTNTEDRVINFDFNSNIHGNSPDIDDPNYFESKIPFANFAITQVLLCFRKVEKIKNPIKLIKQYRKDAKRNKDVILGHVKTNTDLADYFENDEAFDVLLANIVPMEKQISIKMPTDSKGLVRLSFKNDSDRPVFSFGFNTPYGKKPIVLATHNPINRSSIFADTSWSSVNRPALSFRTHITTLRSQSLRASNPFKASATEEFYYEFAIKSPKKPGRYIEDFILVAEGRGVIEKSHVSLEIEVQKKSFYPKRKLQITPEEFLDKLGITENSRKYHVARREFLDWLAILAANDFSHYCSITPMSVTTFLRTFLKDYFEGLSLDKKIYKKTLEYKNLEIAINEMHLQPKKTGEIILVPCNPRVGGTVISQALSEIIEAKHYDGGPYSNSIDFNSVDSKLLLHGHFSPEDINALDIAVPYKVITIKRNPLDSLASAYMFAQHSLFNTLWNDGAVFKGIKFKAPSDITSQQFFDWATSEQSKLLFDYTKSWLNRADSVISYEVYKSDPVRALREPALIIDNSRKYTTKQIRAVVDKLDDSFLVKTHNQHRWRGESDYLEKMLPKEKYQAIRNFHRKDIEVLGYWD